MMFGCPAVAFFSHDFKVPWNVLSYGPFWSKLYCDVVNADPGGLVPTKNITKQDFAINDAVVSSIIPNIFLIHKAVYHNELYIRGDRTSECIYPAWPNRC